MADEDDPRLRRGLQDREAAVPGVEVLDLERRFSRPFPWAPAWRVNGGEVGGLAAEEDLGGHGTREPLMGPEAQVVEERQLEPPLQVRGGERKVESVEAGVLLEGSPEAFQPGRGKDVIDGTEAVSDVQARGYLLEGPLEFSALVGDGVTAPRI
jgi:hypothetical protein